MPGSGDTLTGLYFLSAAGKAASRTRSRRMNCINFLRTDARKASSNANYCWPLTPIVALLFITLRIILLRVKRPKQPLPQLTAALQESLQCKIIPLRVIVKLLTL